MTRDKLLSLMILLTYKGDDMIDVDNVIKGVALGMLLLTVICVAFMGVL